ncbi:MAG: hypothetical protein V4602_06425 [Pseudomonadota bacterium]
MRTILILAGAVLVLTTAGVQAEKCSFGDNRPAIDTMDRNITPGGTTVACEQRTVTMTTPSGRERDVKMWTFQKAK